MFPSHGTYTSMAFDGNGEGETSLSIMQICGVFLYDHLLDFPNGINRGDFLLASQHRLQFCLAAPGCLDTC